MKFLIILFQHSQKHTKHCENSTIIYSSLLFFKLLGHFNNDQFQSIICIFLV